MSEKTPVIPNPWMQAASSDDIDLRELVLVLWRQKILILFITALFALAGLGYALTAREVWTGQAVISEPSIEQIDAFQLTMDKLKNESSVALDFSTLQRPALYQSFIKSFNSEDNKLAFLTSQGIFTEERQQAGVTDPHGEHALMSQLAQAIAAKPVDKTSADMILSFSARTPALAQQRLIAYIDFVQQQEVAEKNAELTSLWHNRIAALTSQYENLKAETLLARDKEIRRTQYSLRISQAAGVDEPLEQMNSENLFKIDLGSKGLAEKLRILKEIKDPEMLDQGLADIRQQLNALTALKLTTTPFESFKMIDSPEQPFTRDKPKRPLIVVLATLLGGMLGVALVLVRHAFRRPEAA